MIRRMTLADLPRVTEIHATSWSPNELSVKLGRRFIEMFYSNIVESPLSFGYVYETEGTIVGYAVGFHDYHAFNSSVSKAPMLRILFTQIIRGYANLGDILNLFLDGKKLRKAQYPKHHLGALALANEFKGTPLGKSAITETIGAVIGELEQQKYPGCWGLCDEQNIPMRKYLVKLGFEEIDVITLVGKKVVLYEKPFSRDAQTTTEVPLS